MSDTTATGSSGYHPDPAAPWFVVAGDEAALAAIGTIAAALPAGRTAHVIVEIPTDHDRIELTSAANLITTWLARGDEAPGALLEAELRRMHLPLGDGHLWVAAESAVARRIGDHLVEDRHVERSRLLVRGHGEAEDGSAHRLDDQPRRPRPRSARPPTPRSEDPCR